MSDTDALQVQSAQRAQSKRATIEALRDKKPRETELTAEVNGEKLSFLFRAISSRDYDKLMTANGPTKEQEARGQYYNPETFGPALLSRVCAEPKLEDSDWRGIWDSPDWSGGEITELFQEAINICGQGLNLVPTVAG